MLQTIRSVVLELQPESVAQLRAQLARMEKKQTDLATAYSAIKAAIPLLHFMSVTIFPDDQYDPILVIEVNFDGPPGPFWSQFEAAFNEDLRDMLRCGKVPRDGRAALFSAVTTPGSRRPIAPLLEALTVKPAVGHQGNRGLDRLRIEQDGAIFADAQKLIDTGAIPPGTPQPDMHAALRKMLAVKYPSLDEAAPPRVTPIENRADWLRLGGFITLVLLALCLPGILISLVLTPGVTVLVLAISVCVALSRLGLSWPAGAIASPTPAFRKSAGLIVLAILLFIAMTAALWAFPASFHHWRPDHFGARFLQCAGHIALGLLGVPATLAGVLVAIRWLENRDPVQNAPKLDAASMQAMARREDKIAQNHMGSVVHLKPGVLRAAVVRVALHGLGLFLRVSARNGYLGSMRTIHFAHWAFISNGARLMFFSNFDGSWESYLDDFIEKAHAGLTLAWTSGVGFPATRFLVMDGATQGRKFKTWARHSMAESLFWYSGYISFTVNQIERQARIADGLRKRALDPKEAEAWALDL